MKYFVTIEQETFEVELAPEGATVDGEPVSVDLAQVPGTPVRTLLVDGASHRLVAGRKGSGRWELHLAGRRLACEAVDERTKVIREMTAAVSGPAGPAPVRAPMPGLVVKIEVEEGQEVAAGQGMAIVEAMKMENELKAAGPGVVSAIHVAAGDTVEKDQVLIDLAPLDGENGEDGGDEG